ncbi:MAG: hypothetical protein NTU44_19270 [Bacteroidetes bacterium]|nr:hypothetical protein [Bacteroidota bacterium]
MTTNNNQLKIYRTALIIWIVALLNIGSAQNFYLRGASFQDAGVSFSQGNEDVPPASLLPSLGERKSVIDEMTQNPVYWIDYLNTNVINEEPGTVTAEDDFTSSLGQLLSDPDYWVNYLNEQVNSEDESGHSVLTPMETDPLYWKHFLDKQVEVENL